MDFNNYDRIRSVFTQFGACGVEMKPEKMAKASQLFVFDYSIEDDFGDTKFYYLQGSRLEIQNMLYKFAPWDVNGFMDEAFELK